MRPRCGGGRMPRAHARSLTVFTLSFLAVCLVLARSRLLWSAALFHHQPPDPEFLLARAEHAERAYLTHKKSLFELCAGRFRVCRCSR